MARQIANTTFPLESKRLTRTGCAPLGKGLLYLRNTGRQVQTVVNAGDQRRRRDACAARRARSRESADKTKAAASKAAHSGSCLLCRQAVAGCAFFFTSVLP